MIRLSLIIPTHNRSERLIAALESVIRQDLPAADWECVVVSNNSTDDTVARFGDFAARYPGLNLRLVTEDGPGVSYARNRGIAETSAPLLVFIDDDERINPGFLRAYADFFDAHPDAVVAGGRIIAEYVTGRPAWLSKYTEMPIANPMDFGDAVRPFPAGRVPGGGNMAFRRSAALRYGGFDPSLGRVGRMLIGGEENDFFERLMRGAQMGDHRAFAVGRDERHAFARTLRAPEDDRFHTQVFERLHEEVARRILSDLADEPDIAAQFGHGADGVARRAAE